MTGSGDVQVRTGNSSQVQVTGRIKASSEWFGGNAEEKIKRLEANPPIQQSTNDIRIGHIDDPELRRNISISYEVTVPAETELRVESGSGNQTVDGIRGPLEVTAGSGGLKISAIGDRVHAETGSGDIEIDRVKGNVRAKTGSGSIQAEDIAGGFEADSGSGHIRLEQTAPGSVRVDTGSGGMNLRGVRGSLEAKAGSGTIEAEGSPTGAWTVHTGLGFSGAENPLGRGVRSGRPHQLRFNISATTPYGARLNRSQGDTRPGRRRRCPSRRRNRIRRYRNPVKQSSVVSLQPSANPLRHSCRFFPNMNG